MALLTGALLVGAASPATSSSQGPNALSPYGVNIHAPSGAALLPQLGAVRRAGIGWVRIDLAWSVVEPEPGRYDWSLYDRLLNSARNRGLEVVAIVGFTPAWATDGPPLAGVPRDVADWERFCRRVGRRYQDRVAAFEVWNEPNLERFWAGSREEYLQKILLPGAAALRHWNPEAVVAGPGLAHLRSGDWWRWLYDTLTIAGPALDVVTHHAYDSDGYREVTEKLEDETPFGEVPAFWDLIPPSVAEVLSAAGATGKPFWLTETGWQGPQGNRRWQAQQYAGFLGQWLTGHPERDWVDKVFFYELQDDPSAAPWGILTAEGRAKSAWRTYKRFIAEHPAPLP